ncbi:ABC-2 type transport system permease protein [Allocatelliglobosispora scoriae]|uniref:ABC-2 type transport system permease protein n=1 Tax=Allocatelliglobosispora scoriae TaxID=643052 RepID=A0A841BRR2_9ACTN|nr:ABC transporter permease [Allocatelliglobosispora scoriae]MBB5869491.1 ABC-2 type transport system permease protein [Allocatelliglobosispora scoriae]
MSERSEGAPGTRLTPYWELLKAQVRGQASYRASFWLDMVGNFALLGGDLLTVIVLFQVTPSLGGFTRPQVLVMFALGMVAFNVADLAVGNIERIRMYVRTGTLDTVLIRPLGVLSQLLALDFGVRRIGRVLYAVTILVVALVLADVAWTPAKAVLVVVAPIAGAALFGSIFVAASAVAFWWIESGEIAATVTYGGRDFSTYPITVYGQLFRRVFAYGLGFGFVAYYPALVLLELPDPLGLPELTGWASPLVALVAVGLAALVWRTGVRHYRSTGS